MVKFIHIIALQLREQLEHFVNPKNWISTLALCGEQCLESKLYWKQNSLRCAEPELFEGKHWTENIGPRVDKGSYDLIELCALYPRIMNFVNFSFLVQIWTWLVQLLSLVERKLKPPSF